MGVALPAQAPNPASPGTSNASKSVWSGVYTASQAARGKQAFDLTCSGCHGADLSGIDGPALVGEAFLRNWLEDNMESLVAKIQTRMPGDAPGSLTREEAADLASYILSANDMPPGAEELPSSSSALSAIQIVGKNGPGPVPNFALVLVVGCLAQKGGTDWVITHGTEPVRTRDSGPEPAGRAETLGAAPAGAQTFSLMDVGTFSPDAHDGHKVAVKGLLMREARGTRLNVTSLQAVGATCP
jgi:quinoprotein glucose dehydrogenase